MTSHVDVITTAMTDGNRHDPSLYYQLLFFFASARPLSAIGYSNFAQHPIHKPPQFQKHPVVLLTSKGHLVTEDDTDKEPLFDINNTLPARR
jgi:hypothetical protein